VFHGLRKYRTKFRIHWTFGCDKIQHDLKNSVIINCSHTIVAGGAKYIGKELSVSNRKMGRDGQMRILYSALP
jgi:hypothetical protein